MKSAFSYSVYCICVLLTVTCCLAPSISFAHSDHSDDEVAIAPVNGTLVWDFGLRIFVTYEMQQRLPDSWNAANVALLGAGITSRIGPYVHGAAINDNLFVIDGIDQNDVATGTGALELTPEVIDSMEIRTGAFPASEGKFMGSKYSVQTKSGTNDWHGTVRVDRVDTSWNEDDEHYDYSPADYDYWQPTITLSGPILKDKLWFQTAYSTYEQSFETTTVSSFGGDYFEPEGRMELDRSIENSHPFIKLTARPAKNHKLNLVWFSNEYNQENFSGDPMYSLPETWTDMESSSSTMALDWTWMITKVSSVSLKAGQYQNEFNILPKKQSSDPRDAPFRDDYYRQMYNNGDQWSEETRENTQFSVDVDFMVTDFFGDHSFETGIEVQQQSRDQMSKIPGGAEYYIYNNGYGYPPDYFYGDTAERRVMLSDGTAETGADYLAVYLQDNWSVNDHLELYLGLRYEQMEYQNDTGNSDVPAWSWGQFKAQDWRTSEGGYLNSTDMCFDGMIAPRIRLIYDLYGDSSTVFHGFMGRYYNPFDHSLPGMFQPFEADLNAYRDQSYTGPEWTDMNRDGIPDEDYFFDDANWQTVDEDEPGLWNVLDPDLEPEYTDEIILGFQHQLSDRVRVGLNYVHRETNDLIEDVGLFLDEGNNVVWTYLGGVNDSFTGLDPNRQRDPRAPYRSSDGEYEDHIYWITNADGNTREYDGVELTVEARDKNWEARFYYTWSEANGSTIEGAEAYSGIAQFSGQYDTFATSQNLNGELPWSATHTLKLAGAYWFDLTEWYEMSFGVNLYWNSGNHYSKRSNPPKVYDPEDPSHDPDDPWTWANPPYYSFDWYYMEPRGSHELPSVSNIDLTWQNRFRLDRWGTMALILDIQNLTDSQTIIAEQDVYNPRKPDLFGQTTGYKDPRSYRVTLKYSF